jgi:hypothetical protein
MIEQLNGKILLNKIHPKNGDKYSPNLFKWLNKRKENRANTCHVFKDQNNFLYVGYIQNERFYGARLITILCMGNKIGIIERGKSFKFSKVDNFWKDYVEDGRCAIDPDHTMRFTGDETRWKVNGNKRICLWCNKVRQAYVKKQVTVETNQWENI